MIITGTPFRISFFGGGSDYPAWYETHGGAVLSTSIDKYCYITCRYLPPFFEYRSRIIWTRMENVNEVSEIQHPVVREALKLFNIHDGITIHHDADLPARAGLGSSSAFTVGLLHALHTLMGRAVSKRQLALEAIHFEQNILKENVGSQDQVASAMGGFHRMAFGGPDTVTLEPIVLSPARLKSFEDRLMLFFTGFARTASEIAEEQIKNTKEGAKDSELTRLVAMVDEAADILQHEKPLREFGVLLDEAWRIKKSLSSRISTPRVDEIYAAGKSAGALGGKLLGAGGGGFILFFVEPELRARVKEKLSSLLHVPFHFENLGSHIIHYSRRGHDERKN